MIIDSKLLLLRLKLAFGVDTNIDLAKKLDVPYATLNTWLARKSLPLEAILANPMMDKISIDWLLGKEDGERIEFSKFPSLVSAMELAVTTEDSILKFNTLLDGFIIEEIIEKLLNAYEASKANMPNTIITRIKRLLFNVTNGRFLMLLDEMLGKLKSTKTTKAKDRIQEITSGDLLHPFLSKPIFKKSEQVAFQAWVEDLSIEEAEFLVTNANQIRESLSAFIPKISKANTSFDVMVMKKLTS